MGGGTPAEMQRASGARLAVKATEVCRCRNAAGAARSCKALLRPPRDSDPAFKVAFAMTLLIWTVGGLAIALAIFAR